MTVSSKKLEPVFMRIKTSVLYLVPIKRYLGNREGVTSGDWGIITVVPSHEQLCWCPHH